MMKRPVFLRTTDSFYSHINVNIYRKSTSFILLLLRKKYVYGGGIAFFKRSKIASLCISIETGEVAFFL